MSRLTRDGTAEPVSRGQIFRREQRGEGNIHFPCSADHVHDDNLILYPVDPCSYYMRDYTECRTTNGSCFSHSAYYWLPTRKNYFTLYTLVLIVANLFRGLSGEHTTHNTQQGKENKSHSHSHSHRHSLAAE